jgi:hypothetical protein
VFCSKNGFYKIQNLTSITFRERISKIIFLYYFVRVEAEAVFERNHRYVKHRNLELTLFFLITARPGTVIRQLGCSWPPSSELLLFQIWQRTCLKQLTLGGVDDLNDDAAFGSFEAQSALHFSPSTSYQVFTLK